MLTTALVPVADIAQFSAVLSSCPLSQFLSSNITEAISLSIDEVFKNSEHGVFCILICFLSFQLNSNFGRQPVGDQQFFFVQIKDPSLIRFIC